MSDNIRGLTEKEVEKSKETYGDNSLTKEKRKSFFRRFFENLSDPIIRILIIALAIEVIFTFKNCNYIEILGILAAVLASTTVSTASEYRSERAFEKLEADSLGSVVSVLRDGKIRKIPVSDIVVGDIMYVSAGEKIHADGTVISGKISVDQSALNGESIECAKLPGSERGWELSSESKVFRGTVVTDGTATVRVGRVGLSTFYGMVAKDVQTETRRSPLKLRLARLASDISKLGYVVAIIVGLSYVFNAIVVDSGFDWGKITQTLRNFPSLLTVLLHALTLMITVVVVAAPEGLPMMITVVLSANMKKMLEDSILVKKLVGIETAGSMNILFTDKTGTITEGKPECERIITLEDSCKTMKELKKCGEVYRYLTVSAKYNTDVISIGEEMTGGNATDRAIFEFFSGEECEAKEIESKVSFSSERKYSSVSFSDGITLIKGAAEVILSSCKAALMKNGEIVGFDVKRVYSDYVEAVNRGERVICIALNGCKGIGELVFVGLIVMKDKVRRGVKDAVREVQGAGIQIVMITGDSKETATAIATECGIMNPNIGHIALGSDELHNISDEELAAVLPKIRVISRALPQDKTRLVRISQELDLVVGMTGDGINDAPSLKLADIGFAMGSGTDIAKSASDIVILDNSFLAICKTVLYGRTIFKSIRKFITFQLTMNLAACGVSLLGQYIGVDTPITIIQMLWVNIIMDTLGGLAFAGEAPLKYYMREKPKRRDEAILSREMVHSIFFNGIYTLVMCIVFLTSYVFRSIYATPEKFYTAFYALFIFAGIFNCFSARSERLLMLSNISKNKPFVLIMLLISVIQILMIYLGGELFRCTPLSAKELLFVIGLAFSVIPFDIVRRIIYKLK